MLIGIDLDNTIVCYDELFHRVAVQAGLIPPTLSATKDEVREYLRRHDREREWTALQGRVYGSQMSGANPFPGVLEFFAQCKASGVVARIISHRTQEPFLGPACDLHEAAHSWLQRQGFYDVGQIGLGRKDVFLELTKERKLERIFEVGCTHFIDDLPEFLEAPGFPSGVQRILFDPAGRHRDRSNLRSVSSWVELGTLLAEELSRTR